MRIGRIFSVSLVVVSLLSLPAWGQTTGTLTITEDTVLTQDHFGPIDIAEDGVSLDCDDHAVVGSREFFGISVNLRTGVTVKNCHVTGFGNGFAVLGSSNSTFEDNTAATNSNAGFLLTTNFTGVGFGDIPASGNTLTGNVASGNGRGFAMTIRFSDNKFRDNTAIDNRFDGFSLVGGSRNTFIGNMASNNSNGFSLINSDLNTLRENIARENFNGYSLIESDGNTLRNNLSIDNLTSGFRLFSSINRPSISSNT